MNKQRKHYESIFRLEVARRVIDQGLSITIRPLRLFHRQTTHREARYLCHQCAA